MPGRWCCLVISAAIDADVAISAPVHVAVIVPFELVLTERDLSQLAIKADVAIKGSLPIRQSIRARLAHAQARQTEYPDQGQRSSAAQLPTRADVARVQHGRSAAALARARAADSSSIPSTQVTAALLLSKSFA